MADRKSVIQVKFRLRKDVLRRLEKSAQANDRSVNDEIGRRLEDSFRQEDQRALIEATVDQTLAALRAIREAEGPRPLPTLPDTGLLGGGNLTVRHEQTPEPTPEVTVEKGEKS